MAGILSYVPGAGRLMGLQKPRSINLEPVQVHQIETNPDRRARCLKHLLKANHVNYSIVYHDLHFVNHNAHLLSSAYLLGATDVHLHALYESEVKELEPWTPSPAEVVDTDWRDFWGDKHYQRAYVDFFEDKLAMTYNYDWKREVDHFLFSGEEPLFYGLTGGLGHVLIHLGYAYEMDCKEIAMEALGLACVEYNFLSKYFADSSYTRPSSVSGTPLELLTKMSEDPRFDKFPKEIDFDQIEGLFEKHQDLILEYWNAWNLDDPTEQFRLSQEAAVSLVVATVKPDSHAYNFFVVHLLTSSHAVRILLPYFPPQHRITLVREWWLFAIMVFIIKGRPQPNPDNIKDGIGGRDWKYVDNQGLNSPWSKDAHYVKALRAFKEAAATWGDDDQVYIRSALTFVDNFDGWRF
ncbi:hypothetical protein HIM_07138 [Hirsutella minnesotensis 3608]|uniref:MGS207 protein n=1 Tax=Hirsutella minnesotensis 3608 TaxID=1043627 RepID=A0A0F7ZZ45_9HYPO|nr:hypothetical protein HIM_07138 [Hirsutella minnesotensis 3608]